MRSRETLLCLSVVFFICGSPAESVAQDDKESGDASERGKRQEVMNDVMSRIRVYVETDGKDLELERSDKPVTHYSDNTRDYEDGTLWAFTKNGRPLALTTCYTRDVKRGNWTHATTSLSTGPLRCTKDGAFIWNPRTPGIKFEPLPGAPENTTSSEPRLKQQTRQIARRFKAWQFWDPNNQRFDLRLQTRPVIEYVDQSAGVEAGAVFLFTHGVNPEMVLLVEAVKKEKISWQYAIAKIGSAEFHATLDDEKVYQSGRAPGVIGRKTDPYFMFFSRTKPTSQK